MELQGSSQILPLHDRIGRNAWLLIILAVFCDDLSAFNTLSGLSIVLWPVCLFVRNVFFPMTPKPSAASPASTQLVALMLNVFVAGVIAAFNSSLIRLVAVAVAAYCAALFVIESHRQAHAPPQEDNL
jgi:hypothetical protein